MPINPVPEGFHTLTPYLLAKGVGNLIDFLKRAFNATEMQRTSLPDGTIMHAQVRIGDSMLMMGDPCDKQPAIPVHLYLYLPDADATYRQAMEAGGTSMSEPKDEFYGDRVGAVKDPAGNTWWIATHKEDVADGEIKRRLEAAMKQRGK